MPITRHSDSFYYFFSENNVLNISNYLKHFINEKDFRVKFNKAEGKFCHLESQEYYYHFPTVHFSGQVLQDRKDNEFLM